MPSFIEIVEITMLGTSIATLIVSVLRFKNKRNKSKHTYENKKDLR